MLKMNNLKTLEELTWRTNLDGNTSVEIMPLTLEAIKWIKNFKKDNVMIRYERIHQEYTIRQFMKFFNLIEEDLE